MWVEKEHQLPHFHGHISFYKHEAFLSYSKQGKMVFWQQRHMCSGYCPHWPWAVLKLEGQCPLQTFCSVLSLIIMSNKGHYKTVCSPTGLQGLGWYTWNLFSFLSRVPPFDSHCFCLYPPEICPHRCCLPKVGWGLVFRKELFFQMQVTGQASVWALWDRSHGQSQSDTWVWQKQEIFFQVDNTEVIPKYWVLFPGKKSWTKFWREATWS